jgi:hypothetical protein
LFIPVSRFCQYKIGLAKSFHSMDNVYLSGKAFDFSDGNKLETQMNTANKSNRDAYRWWFTMICSFGWLAGSAAGALAISVPILNASFESPWVEESSQDGNIDNWVVTGDTYHSGVQVPQSYYYLTGVDGRQVGWVWAGALSQVLTATIQANAVYTLKALVGTWSTKSPTYAVQLVDSNNGVVLSQATGSCNLGSLVEVATPPYRANSHPEYIGHTLKIVLIGSGEEDNFDRVALDYALVSQPGALLLLLED